MSLLEVDGVRSGYGKLPVVHGASLRCDRGEVIGVIGPNGAGKSTLMKAIFGLLPVVSGKVSFDGVDVSHLAARHRAELGMGFVPQDGNTFPELTVDDNLRVGLTAGKHEGIQGAIEQAYEAFPRLADRRRQRAKTLSGGERQMLALASAWVNEPRFLALDEPVTGLAPTIVEGMIAQILGFRDSGTTVLWVVEEDPMRILPHIDRVYLMQGGVIERELRSEQILDDESLAELFFGTAETEGNRLPSNSTAVS